MVAGAGVPVAGLIANSPGATPGATFLGGTRRHIFFTMNRSILPRVLPLVLGGVLSAACRSATPAAPAPVAPAPATVSAAASTAPADTKPDSARHGYTAADVRFMQQMIAHHAQAIVMASLVPTHSTRDDMKLIAQRIDVSQRSEISAMQHWLRDRGETVPEPDAHAMHAAMGHDMSAMSHDAGGSAMPLMPGMLTDAELAQLGASRGPDFDRLFLQDMIRHHEGALSMVADLFATRGAAQESQIYGFATDVDADQRAEIARMRALLETMGGAR